MRWWTLLVSLLAWMIGGVCSAALAQSSGPTFSTQTPLSGLTGSTFVVLLPLVNTGTDAAANVQVTAVGLGNAPLASPTLPLAVGTLSPQEHNVVDVRFDGTNLVVGNHYLLAVRGTYQFGTQTLGFAVNRFLTVTVPSGSGQTELQRWVALDDVSRQSSPPFLIWIRWLTPRPS
jgi:hypothetical protein